MKRNIQEVKDKKSSHQIDFKQSSQLIKKFLLKRRFKYVWDNLMTLYIENQKLLGNIEVLQTVKLAYKTLKKKIKVMNLNGIIKKKQNVKQRVKKVYELMITVFKAHQNVLEFQLEKQDPEFFNMVFPSKMHMIKENSKPDNCLLKPSQNRGKSLQNKEKQLIYFIKNYLNLIIQSTLQIASNYPKKEVITFIKMSNKIFKQFESKYFPLQKISYQIVKLKVVQCLNLTTQDLEIQFQIPIDLLGKIYLRALKWQTQKLNFHLKFYFTYCILSMKNISFSIPQLRQIIIQSTNLLEFLYTKRHFRNELFEKLIQQVNKQILKFYVIREQLNFMIRNRLPQEKFVVDSQLEIQDAKELFNNPAVQSLQLGRNTENNSSSKKIKNNIIIRNIKEVTKSKQTLYEKINTNNYQDVNTISQIIGFRKLNLIHCSSDSQQQQPRHHFQIKRLQRIKMLQMKQNQKSFISFQTKIESNTTESIQFVRSKSDCEQLRLLDNVLQTDIVQKYEKTAQYKTINQISEKTKLMTILNKQITQKRAVKLQQLREKAQNKLGQTEKYCQYKQEFQHQSRNWMKTPLRKPVKILPNNNTLKLDGTKKNYLIKVVEPLEGKLQNINQNLQ